MLGQRALVLILLGSLLVEAMLAVPTKAETPVEYNPEVCAADNAERPVSQACQDMMGAFPRPLVEEIELDKQTLSNYSFWRVGPDPVTTYDGPNGNANGHIPRGFNFVNIVDQSVEGWLKTQDGFWIKRSDATYSQPSTFRGVLLKNGLQYPFAFVLDKSTTYAAEYPGGPASKKSGRFLKRYERVNIFATAYVTDAAGKTWRWYMIGPNQWVKQTFVAKVQKVAKPTDARGRWVAVDLYEQTLVAYEDETPVFATLVSSGLPKTETHKGLFSVWASLEREGMSGATGAPNAYALQSVPWVMYFDGSISLHGTYWHDLFGYRQSRGCVNLSISDARFIFRWMEGAKPDTDGKRVNYVYVYSTGAYGAGVIRQ